MQKVALVQVVYNSMKFIPPVFSAVFEQTGVDFTFYAIIAGNEDGSKEYIQEHFPQVKIIDPGYNVGFSKGHNDFFAQVDAEFIQLINPDLIVTPTFVSEMLKPFADKTIGAVSGKILQYNFEKNLPTNKIDSTGVIIARSGRGRDRGQHEIDNGQWDSQTDLIAVSGAAAMYRKEALESVKYVYPENHIKKGQVEYFDEEFFMYWEDIDLSWRLVNSGWKIKFAPQAKAFHGRTAGASEGGYKKVWAFIKHHRQIPKQILKWNYKNHIFMFIKNSPKWYWKFFAREFFYHGFALVFETSTFSVLPEFFRQLPSMWQKRKTIQASRKISVTEMEKLLS